MALPLKPAGELVCLNCWAWDRDRMKDYPCTECRRNPNHPDRYAPRPVGE